MGDRREREQEGGRREGEGAEGREGWKGDTVWLLTLSINTTALSCYLYRSQPKNNYLNN